MTTLHARVSGVVQGVGFRYFVQWRARAIGLNGYVRNLPDGDVEVVVEGGREALEEMVKNLRQGPLMASVKGVSVQWAESAEPQFKDFRITY